MAYGNADPVIVSPAWIWYAPVGTTPPTMNSKALGDSTVWTGYTPLGYTLEQLSITRGVERFGVDVQQSTTDIKTALTSEEFSLSSVMAEVSAANLKLLTEGTNTVTAAVPTSQVGFTKTEFGGSSQLSEYAWGIEWETVLANGDRGASRLHLYKGTITWDGDMNIAEGAAASLPFEVAALADATKAVGKNIGYFEIFEEDS